jgi:hypothetical protein
LLAGKRIVAAHMSESAWGGTPEWNRWDERLL